MYPRNLTEDTNEEERKQMRYGEEEGGGVKERKRKKERRAEKRERNGARCQRCQEEGDPGEFFLRHSRDRRKYIRGREEGLLPSVGQGCPDRRRHKQTNKTKKKRRKTREERPETRKKTKKKQATRATRNNPSGPRSSISVLSLAGTQPTIRHVSQRKRKKKTLTSVKV